MPLKIQAAQTEPMVLRTKTNNSGTYTYSYNADGTLLVEDRVCGATHEETWYSYHVNGNLADKTIIVNGKIQEAFFYDEFGTEVEYRNHSGDTIWIRESNPVYDDYGRLILNTIKSSFNVSGSRSNPYEETKLRYEYSSDPVTVFFGHYEQDGNASNGPEPIEWEVLEANGDRMLLISKYALDSRVYHSKNVNISWKDSDLREWLNGEFLEEAFAYNEHFEIRDFQTETGIWDRIFLLSRAETERYFPGNGDRICEATKYAVRQGAYVNRSTGGSWWLLRTPASASQCVMSVNSDGTIDSDGGKVTSKNGTVRPAVWVDVTAMSGNAAASRIHEQVDTYEGGSAVPASTRASLATYNDAGILIHDRQETTYAEGWRSSDWFSYDDSGNLTEAMHSMWFPSGDEDLHFDTCENTYDYAGRLTKQIAYFDGNPERMTQYSYDSKGNMTSRTEYSPGSSWKKESTETWSYDRYGNVLRYSRDGKTDTEYTYLPLSRAYWE
jgi:hypothetical protein